MFGFHSSRSHFVPTIPWETWTRWRPPAIANLLPPFTNLNKNPAVTDADTIQHNKTYLFNLPFLWLFKCITDQSCLIGSRERNIQMFLNTKYHMKFSRHLWTYIIWELESVSVMFPIIEKILYHFILALHRILLFQQCFINNVGEQCSWQYSGLHSLNMLQFKRFAVAHSLKIYFANRIIQWFCLWHKYFRLTDNTKNVGPLNSGNIKHDFSSSFSQCICKETWTGWPYQSICKENSTFNQHCPARSVYFYIACIAVMGFERKLSKEAYFIFKMTDPTSQFGLLVSTLSLHCAEYHCAPVIIPSSRYFVIYKLQKSVQFNYTSMVQRDHEWWIKKNQSEVTGLKKQK